MTLQLLIAGHIVKDKIAEGWRPGGGALYAAAQAAALGVDTAVVTACDAGMRPQQLVPGVQWHVIHREHSITFENIYSHGRRTQRVLSTSEPISSADIPDAWRATPLVLLTPVFHDVAADLPAQLVRQGTIVGLGAQGWLRALDIDRVVPGAVEPAPRWLHGDVVFVSTEDVADPDGVEQWLERVSVVVLTRGRDGCTVWDRHDRHDIPPLPAREGDPTGAGDAFAAAFLIRYAETGDARQSALFASAAGAIAVEAAGFDALGTRDQIEVRMATAGARA